MNPTEIAPLLLGALRVVQTHGRNNDALARAVRRLTKTMNTMASEGEVTVQIIDGVFLVNDQRVRHDKALNSQMRALHSFLHERGVGGIAFWGRIEEVSLAAWIVALAPPCHSDDDRLRRVATMRRMENTGIRCLEPKTFDEDVAAAPVEVSRFAFALHTYARAVVGFTELVDLLKRGEPLFAGRADVVRAVRDIVEIADVRPDFLLEIVEAGRQRADDTPYASRHAANTCVYAVLIGKLLGFDRLSLFELGTAALLADIGLAILPPSLTEREVALSSDERRDLRAFMLRAVQALIGKGHLSDAMIRRVIVAYEHHRPYRNPGTQKRVPLHPYSRIVAVSDAFDAMVTPRPWRKALEHHDAIEEIQSGNDTKFDPVAVSALATLEELRRLTSQN